MFDVKDRVALVTGGTRGIGAGISKALAQSGASVAVNARSQPPAHETFMKELAAIAPAEAFYGDVSQPEVAQDLVDRTIDRFGRLDIIVHAAGGPVPGRIDELTTETWMSTFDTHVHAVFHLFKAAYPALKADGGVMLLISSVAGLRGCPGTFAYQSVKGILPQMARALSMEHAPEGIRVNAVAPGIIRTDFHASMSEEAKRHNVENRIPIRREGTVDDVVSLAMELITNDFIVGETMTIDGGMSMRVTA